MGPRCRLLQSEYVPCEGMVSQSERFPVMKCFERNDDGKSLTLLERPILLLKL